MSDPEVPNDPPMMIVVLKCGFDPSVTFLSICIGSAYLVTRGFTEAIAHFGVAASRGVLPVGPADSPEGIRARLVMKSTV